MHDIVALVDDLLFQSKLAETARHVGVTLKTVATGDALITSIALESPRLIIVDLNVRQGALSAIERLHGQGNSRPVIAFLSHVQTELAERARAAGCNQVLPRSKFTADLARILEQAKS